ncbi:MAG: TMF family protein, partial [Bacteroidia bacterium]
YISENHHLPRIKSAEEYAATGSVNVGELQVQLLEKVEELTLYILTLKEEIDHLKTNLPSTNPSSTHEKP